jgi:hypothetical protein
MAYFGVRNWLKPLEIVIFNTRNLGPILEWIVKLWVRTPPQKTVFFNQRHHFVRQKMFAYGAEYFKNIENLLSGEISLDFHSINEN